MTYICCCRIQFEKFQIKMNCCSQKSLIVLLTLFNLLAYPVFLYFTCKDLLDTHQPHYWTWTHFIPRFFVYIGILLYFRLILWIRILCNPLTQKKVESWAFWMTFPLISFWISLVIQAEWILAGILLIFLVCNASCVEYVKRMDDLPISSFDYGSPTSTRSNSESTPNENEPLLTAVQVQSTTTAAGACTSSAVGYHT